MKQKLSSLLTVFALLVTYLSLPIRADATLGVVDSVITADLLTVMDSVSATDTIPVSIWLNEVDSEVVEAVALKKTGLNRELIRQLSTSGQNDLLTADAVDMYIAAEREIYKRMQAQAHQAFVADYAFLKTATSVETAFMSLYAPMILVELTKAQIQTLAKDETVISLSYAPDVDIECSMNTAISLVRADYLRDKTESPYNGTGIKIGMYESAVPDISNLDYADMFSDKVHLLRTQYGNAAQLDIEHATAVASIMVSVDESYMGIVPQAELYCINYANFYQDLESLLDADVNIINMSAEISSSPYFDEKEYGLYTTYEKWTDHIALNHSVHFVVSAGNTNMENYSDYEDRGKVTHPAMAYNVISVGAIDDRNTIAKEDDILADYSSYAQELGTPNKPDLVAPGTLISTAPFPSAKFPYLELLKEYYPDIDSSVSGTSFSAPIVTGIVAQLLQQYPPLKVQQDLVKAILTASIGHDVHHYSTNQTSAFDQFGAGVVDARSSSNTVRLGNFASSSFAVNSKGETKSYTFNVSSSDTTKRVSLTWLKYNRYTNEGESSENGDLPDTMDGYVRMNLTVITPSGAQILIAPLAMVYQNSNLLVIEFDPEQYGYGTYTLQVSVIGEINNDLIQENSSRIYFATAWW